MRQFFDKYHKQKLSKHFYTEPKIKGQYKNYILRFHMLEAIIKVQLHTIKPRKFYLYK